MGSELPARGPLASVVVCSACGIPQASGRCCAHCGAALPVAYASAIRSSAKRWPARLSAITAIGALALVPFAPGSVRTSGLITRFEAESLIAGMPIDQVRSLLGRPYLVLDKAPTDLPKEGERVWGKAGRWYRKKAANETVWVYTTRQDDLIEVVFTDGLLERVPFVPSGSSDR